MSWLIAAPEYVAAAASDLAGIASTISAANAAAAFPTSEVLAAGADEVSAAIAALFGAHAQAYQLLSAQAAQFHNQFVELMNAGAGQYVAAEAANALPMQPAQALPTDSGQTALIGTGTNAAAGTGQSSGSSLLSGGTGAAGAAGQAGGWAGPLRPGGTGIAAAAATAGPAGRAAAFSGTGGGGFDGNGGDASGASVGPAGAGGLLFGPGALGVAGVCAGNTNGGQQGGNAGGGLPVDHNGWFYSDGYGGHGASLVVDDTVSARADCGHFAPLTGAIPAGFTAPAAQAMDGTSGAGGQWLGQPGASAPA